MTSAIKKSVLITGIGGNVGQGILRCTREFLPEIKIIGTDIGTLTAGHYYCDSFHTIPYAYDDNFITHIHKICDLENVGLIIPSTDYEAFYLSLNQNSLPPVIASPAEVVSACLDKYRTHQILSKESVPFASSCLPSEYRNQWSEIIVKPREGRGSRNVHMNPTDVQCFDDNYVVQQFLGGEEITSCFYINKMDGVLGPITFKRELLNGMTERCETTNEYDFEMAELMTSMRKWLPFAGPINIQAKVQTNGDIIPFELNCRYSGTNSIRSKLGFKDVQYGLQEYLLNEKIELPTITQGSAMRIYMDLIYPEQKLSEIKPGDTHSYLF